jgi:cytochrome c
MAGFDYSEALKAMASHEWDYDELNKFIYNPRQHLPGTKMSYAGLKNDQERANVIAWLRTLADSPVPLPQ